jgi:hypothetical protein
MKYFFILVLTILVSFSSVAQSIHSYEYVIVPTRYEFLNYADKYQLNSLTTFLFNREGFKAFDNRIESIPADVAANKCKALYVDVKDTSGIIRTRLQVELKDCDGNVIFVSEVGSSKLKDYTKAHHAALREAFWSIEELNYSYKPKAADTPKTQSPATDLVSMTKKETQEKSKKMVKTQIDESITISHKSSPQVIEVPGNTVEETPVTYKSENSSYSLIKKGNVYRFYDGTLDIGKAIPTDVGTYLISTSSFNGVGRLEGDSFIIDRQIKGVSGLVQMIFTKQ